MMKDIAENGTSFGPTESGYEGPRPSVGIAVKMLEKMSVLDGKFGLTPSDRSRLDIPMPKETSDWDAFQEEAQRMVIGRG